MEKIIPMLNMEFIRNALTVSEKRTSIFKNPFGDKDKDKVPNFRDCAPLNPRRHGVEPSKIMAQKYRKLPIFVTDQPIREPILLKNEKPETYYFLSKEARKKAPIARKEVLGMLKRTPSIIKEIKSKRPKRIYVESAPSEGVLGYASAEEREIELKGFPKETKEEVIKSYEFMGITPHKPLSLERAGSIRHELEHIHQYRKARKEIQIKKRRTEKIPYEQRGLEKGAYRAQLRFIGKYTKEPKKMEVEEQFGKMFK